MSNNFYINHAKFQDLSNKALDWFIRSWKYKIGSDERKICCLKQRIYNREAVEYLNKAVKELENG